MHCFARARAIPISVPALLLLLCCFVLPGGAGQPQVPRTSIAAHKVQRPPQKINYHGWPDAYLLSNGVVEAIVVPAIGRVMQFRFVGTEGVFFENRVMDGKAPDPVSPDWVNFGGDKSWPSPQADWEKITRRSWPPPVAFDSMPVQARVRGKALELISAIDSAYGIRETRLVELAAGAPRMIITTSYEKLRGDPLTVGVWVITQVSEPERAFVVLPAKSRFPTGYTKLMDVTPAGLKVEDGLISISRDRQNSTKIGSDGGTLLWMNREYTLRIESPRAEGGEYPDQGSSAEIYTNKDPLPYIELETLGPLSRMKTGERIQKTNTYTLRRRSEKDAIAEARTMMAEE